MSAWTGPGRSERRAAYEGKVGVRAGERGRLDNVDGCAVFQDSNVRSLLFQPLRGGG